MFSLRIPNEGHWQSGAKSEAAASPLPSAGGVGIARFGQA
jgi:hypothetical protein